MSTSRAERVRQIQEIEQMRKSRLVTYITSTRPNFGVSMSIDVIRPIYEHLRSFSPNGDKIPAIDLLIHSDGGDGIVPWRLVTLIREFTDKFSVIVPHRAFSAATLTALGADEIVMHPMGMLGPTDPTVMNEFNPMNPINPGQRIGISVEDVSAYLSLVKDDAGIHHEDELIQAFNELAKQVHPLALGNVKRSQLQSRMMARKLLQLHMDKTDEHRMEEIAENLSSKLYFHGHPINRWEAQNELNLKIASPDLRLEEAIWQLYVLYEDEMKLTEPFDPLKEFIDFNLAQVATQPVPYIQLEPQALVYIESTSHADRREARFNISGEIHPNGGASTQVFSMGEGWTRES